MVSLAICDSSQLFATLVLQSNPDNIPNYDKLPPFEPDQALNPTDGFNVEINLNLKKLVVPIAAIAVATGMLSVAHAADTVSIGFFFAWSTPNQEANVKKNL